tara:strand:- start:301 stop:981 length:681 start_codon:yes stop_codon:yes gene_type:complete
MNKTLTTNSVAALILVSSFIESPYQNILFNMGAFALSGSLTNNLAVYMLFEKIPLIYGSGVVQINFNQFKVAIKGLILEEFFNRDNVLNLVSNMKMNNSGDMSHIINPNKIFDEFVEAIDASPLSGMLAMVGGSRALEPLRTPIAEKFSKLVLEVEQNIKEKPLDITGDDNFFSDIESLIDSRLEQLTPKYVKEIISKMIYQHLGWLVVWGGVVGGIVGLVISLSR